MADGSDDEIERRMFNKFMQGSYHHVGQGRGAGAVSGAKDGHSLAVAPPGYLGPARRLSGGSSSAAGSIASPSKKDSAVQAAPSGDGAAAPPYSTSSASPSSQPLLSTSELKKRTEINVSRLKASQESYAATVIEKEKEIFKLKARVYDLEEQVSSRLEDKRAAELSIEMARLRAENEVLKNELGQICRFLNEYGLEWVGSSSSSSSSTSSSSNNPSSFSSQRHHGYPQQQQQARVVEIDYPVLFLRLSQLNSLVGAGKAKVVQRNGMSFFEVPTGLKLSIFADGFQLEDGPFRPLHEQNNLAFIQDVLDGYFPSELKGRHPEGVPFQVVDRSYESGMQALRHSAAEGGGGGGEGAGSGASVGSMPAGSMQQDPRVHRIKAFSGVGNTLAGAAGTGTGGGSDASAPSSSSLAAAPGSGRKGSFSAGSGIAVASGNAAGQTAAAAPASGPTADTSASARQAIASLVGLGDSSIKVGMKEFLSALPRTVITGSGEMVPVRNSILETLGLNGDGSTIAGAAAAGAAGSGVARTPSFAAAGSLSAGSLSAGSLSAGSAASIAFGGSGAAGGSVAAAAGASAATSAGGDTIKVDPAVIAEERQALHQSSTSSSGGSSSHPSFASSQQVLLRIKSEDGTQTLSMHMHAEDSIGLLRKVIDRHRSNSSGYEIRTAVPRRAFTEEGMTLKEAGFVPQAALFLRTMTAGGGTGSG